MLEGKSLFFFWFRVYNGSSFELHLSVSMIKPALQFVLFDWIRLARCKEVYNLVPTIIG